MAFWSRLRGNSDCRNELSTLNIGSVFIVCESFQIIFPVSFAALTPSFYAIENARMLRAISPQYRFYANKKPRHAEAFYFYRLPIMDARNACVRSLRGAVKTCSGAPSSSTTPSTINKTWSATERAKAISCVTRIIVSFSSASR